MSLINDDAELIIHVECHQWITERSMLDMSPVPLTPVFDIMEHSSKTHCEKTQIKSGYG